MMDESKWELVRDPDEVFKSSWEFLLFDLKNHPDYEQGADRDGDIGGWAPATHDLVESLIGRRLGARAQLGWVRRLRSVAAAVPTAPTVGRTEGDRLVQYFVRATPVDVVLKAWPQHDID